VQSPSLNRDIARYKSYTAKQLIQYPDKHKLKQILEQPAFYKKAHKNDRGYQFRQEGVHPELIQGDEMIKQKIKYIHHNLVKRGYIDKTEPWRYFSAGDYLGQVGLLKVYRQW